jgi:Flp pilus assembly protein TadB
MSALARSTGGVRLWHHRVVLPLNPDDFAVRDEDQPHFTRGQNAMIVAFLIVPVWISLIVLGYIARAYWLWIIAGVIFALGNLAPVIRNGVERHQRRKTAR